MIEASDSEWVSVGEAAFIVGVSVATIRRYESAGRLVCYRTPTNQRRYRRTDVAALLTVQASSEAAS